jgi:hypothetical protein
VRAALVAVLLLAACPGRGGTPASDSDAVVVIRTEAPDAVLWVDGRYIGPIASLKGGVAIAPGAHRIEVRDDAHFSRYLELDLAPHERKVIDVQLAPVLP